ncbi:MAG: hypothetical protein HFE04_02020 [Bacilli bacterium]|nr:hypothetical protein [Bacilli bacterium]
MNDILSMIIGDEKLFELYTCTQDEISTFLIVERDTRRKRLVELKSRLETESRRQKEAVSKLLISMKNNNFYGLTGDILKTGFESEQLRREAASQDILVMVEMELSRQRAALEAFNILLDIREKQKFEDKLKFNVFGIDRKEYDFPKKYTPSV